MITVFTVKESQFLDIVAVVHLIMFHRRSATHIYKAMR